jgi:predicted transposase/invertase (TIGR01784 family)
MSEPDNAFEKYEELEIKPTSDLFIGIFLSNPNNEWILVHLLNAVLQDSGWSLIVAATVLNPISLQDYSVERRVVLDVRVRDEQNRFYNIEVQTNDHTAFEPRILLGWAKTYAGQAARGSQYGELNPVFAIVITEFAIFPKSDKLHLQFSAREIDENIVFCDHLQIHVLRLAPVLQGALNKLNQVSPKLAYWISFLIFGKESEETMAQLTAQNPVIGEAFAQPEIQEAMRQFTAYKADPVSRNLEERRRMFDFDQKLEVNDSRKAGRVEGRVESAKRMKAKGYAVADIAEITELPVEEIERL